MQVRIFMDTPTCSYLLESNRTMELKHLITLFLSFVFYDVFWIFHAYVLMMYLMLLADVGLERPVGVAPEAWRDPQGIRKLALVHPAGSSVETVAHNLEGLTKGIPNYRGD